MLADYSTLTGCFLNRNTESIPRHSGGGRNLVSLFSRRYIPSTLVYWIPVCTGMASGSLPYSVIPEEAGILIPPVGCECVYAGCRGLDVQDGQCLEVEIDAPWFLPRFACNVDSDTSRYYTPVR
jgi:hypothetical protein